MGVRILRVLWNMTESKQKLGSPGDQSLGSFGKRPWSRSQISWERSGSPRFLDIDFTSFNFTEFIYQFFFFFFGGVLYNALPSTRRHSFTSLPTSHILLLFPA